MTEIELLVWLQPTSQARVQIQREELRVRQVAALESIALSLAELVNRTPELSTFIDRSPG